MHVYLSIYIFFLCFYVVCSVSVSSSTISRCLILKRRLYSSSAARISNMYRGFGFPVQKKKKLKKCYTVIKTNKFVRKNSNIDRKRLFNHFVVYFCAIFYNKNIQVKPYQSTHFFIYHWAFTDGFVQGKPNIDEYFWIRSSAEVRNDTESAWIIVEGSRSRNKAWFSKLM